jgi:signal peptidase I
MDSKSKASGFWELVRTIFYALLIALCVRTFFFQVFNIPSSSMVPTLLIGDYLFVTKFSYGYSRYSLPFGLPLFSGRIWPTTPERGDVVVFKLPSDRKTDYIKRIVGLPGDRVQVVGGILTINGVPVQRQALGEYVALNSFGVPQVFQRYLETLPNGRQHEIIEISDREPLDNTPVYTVPANSYFAMGDNRDVSSDSRILANVGYIPFVNIVGRADLIFFSIDGSVFRIWEWPQSLRFSRMFTLIH